MNNYEKRLNTIYNHKPNCTMLDWLKLKEENSYLSAMLDSGADNYERLIDDIINCREISIDGKRFFVPELING